MDTIHLAIHNWQTTMDLSDKLGVVWGAVCLIAILYMLISDIHYQIKKRRERA